jgi:RNA polymerase sigma-70 factor, ECF subfamily
MSQLALVLAFVPRSLQQSSDAELVAQAQLGQRSAQRALYERHLDRTMARVWRLLGRVTEAQDVVQDAFFEAFRDLDQLRDGAHFDRWLMRIAVHQVHRRFRRRRLLRVLGLDRGADDLTLTAIADPNANSKSSTLLSELHAALASLPANERLAWMLRHVEGAELSEVADQCSCSLATAKRWLKQGEQKLHAHVDWHWQAASGDDHE